MVHAVEPQGQAARADHAFMLPHESEPTQGITLQDVSKSEIPLVPRPDEAPLPSLLHSSGPGTSRARDSPAGPF